MSKNPAALLPIFKPEWAFDTPDGYRDEVFLVPFTFTIPGDGSLASKLPWSFDDDVPQIIRGIVFSELGTSQGNDAIIVPGLIRIWDGHGNPLSDDLVLALGVWCQSGFGRVNAFGFPVEPEVQIPEGGVVQFDFQLSTNALAAFLGVDSGAADFMTFVAGVFTAAANAWTIQFIDPGAPNVALSIALVGGTHVQITLATNGASAITSTFLDVVNLVNNNPTLIPAPAPFGAFPIILAVLNTGNGSTVVTPGGPFNLGSPDGTNYAAPTPQVIAGTFLCVKRFKEC